MRRRTRRPNGTGCLIFRGAGRNYLCKYTDVDGRVHVKSTGTFVWAEAMKFLEERTAQTRSEPLDERIKMLETQLDILKGRANRREVALGELWSVYKNLRWEKGIAGRTEKNYISWISDLVKFMSLHGVKNVSGVTVELAEVFLKDSCAKLSPGAYNNRLLLFKSVWKLLDEKNVAVRENVWEKFRKREASRGERRVLSVEEVRSLMEKADDELRLLIMLSYYTSQRCSDCCLLKWSQVDLESGKIALRQKKTGNDVSIPISSELRRALEAWVDKTGDEEYVCPRNAHDYLNNTIHRRLGELFDKCGIERHYRDGDGRVKILTGFHALRHTFASNAANSLSMAELQAVLGWSSSKMAGVYVHVNDSAVKKAVESMERIA
jgi:integrase